MENGELVLINDNDIKAEKTKMFVILNPQEQMFEFTLIPSAADEETVFTFRLTEANKGVLENTLP